MSYALDLPTPPRMPVTTWIIWWFQLHLKNISQNGNLPQIGVKRKIMWNHHPVNIFSIGNSQSQPSPKWPAEPGAGPRKGATGSNINKLHGLTLLILGKKKMVETWHL